MALILSESQTHRTSQSFCFQKKDQQTAGVAVFENDDVTYNFVATTKTTPRTYLAK